MSNLLLEDGFSSLLLEDGASLLLLEAEIPIPDHQWDNKIIPVVGTTIAYRIGTGVGYKVTSINRPNFSSDRPNRYGCSVLNMNTGVAGVADVWYDGVGWKCDSYIPVRFRDLDGVMKNL